MFVKEINLKDHYNVKGGTLRALCSSNPFDGGHEEWRRPALIVVPGGGYHFVSVREAEPVASKFYASGFQVFILNYLCRPDGVVYPEELLELSCAIDYVKSHAQEFFVNPEEVFAIGFSAGGHLVADMSNEYENVPEYYGGKLDCRLTGAALCYPVIDTHGGTLENLTYNLSGEEKEEMKRKLEMSGRVTSATPPTFVWTTAEDDVVPPSNSLKYALALDSAKVPYELHVYPKGGHGLSTGGREINEREVPALDIIAPWVKDCIRFFLSFCIERI